MMMRMSRSLSWMISCFLHWLQGFKYFSRSIKICSIHAWLISAICSSTSNADSVCILFSLSIQQQYTWKADLHLPISALQYRTMTNNAVRISSDYFRINNLTIPAICIWCSTCERKILASFTQFPEIAKEIFHCDSVVSRIIYNNTFVDQDLLCNAST
jgi:hypothetical protein